MTAVAGIAGTATVAVAQSNLNGVCASGLIYCLLRTKVPSFLDLTASLKAEKKKKADLEQDLTDVKAAFLAADMDIGALALKLVVMSHIWKNVSLSHDHLPSLLTHSHKSWDNDRSPFRCLSFTDAEGLRRSER